VAAGPRATGLLMSETIDLGLARDFAFALLIGALIGLEREKRKAAERDHSIGGIRTFILFAISGAMAAWLARQLAAPWIFGGATLGATALVVAGYVVQVRAGAASLGLTTEIAAMATFLLGGVCLAGQPGLAVALGIAVSAVLAWKQPLHGLVDKIGTDDLYAGLKLLIASFIVLPLLPREAIDPWGALKPYELWLLVVLISALSLVGYVAVRALGAGRGTLLTGLFGGLVSSTAVTLSFARRSRDEPGASGVLAAGLLVAWAVMFARVVGIVAAVHAPLVAPLLLPFGVMGAVTLAAAALFYVRAGRGHAAADVAVPLRNPFSLRSAVYFALLFAVVLLAVAIARDRVPAQGFYGLAALAGLTDVDAITLSMATYARGGGEAVTAANAITIAALSNTLVKLGIVVSAGAAALRTRTLGASIALAVATALTLGSGL
jgi:uncharacterized membrane protein (DUF4010 family)